MWNKIGLVFRNSRAQLPVVSAGTDSEFQMFFSNRDREGRSVGNTVGFDVGRNFKFTSPRKIIKPGSPGDCDAAGVMPMQSVGQYLFYIGWTLRKDVPYFNYTCVGRFESGTVRKLGPIIPPDIVDAGYSGTFFVYEVEGIYLGYYLSSIGWVPDEAGELQPKYNIKVAESFDLLYWRKTGRTAIELEDNEAGISSFTAIKLGSLHHAWFSVRGAKYFRDFSANSYRIKHAISLDGIHWTRDNSFSLLPSPEKGENMCAYPSVFKRENILYMFYNGFSFGEGGVSCATLNVNDIEQVVGDSFQ